MGKTKKSDTTEKADKKFDKKVEFYSKVRESVANLSATKGIEKKNRNARRRQKKLKAYDLSTLSDFLPELKEPQLTAVPFKSEVKCKSRQKIVVKEAKRLTTVLSDPGFQSDPLAAIHQYLQSTQPPLDIKPVKRSKDDKKKKKKSKSSAGMQSMEM